MIAEIMSLQKKVERLEDQNALLTQEIRDTHKKIRSKLDFLLKRVQDLEEAHTAEKS
jgi:uncharacterized coiled-coil protein SlyX|tara:strand:+ start:70 stop:240 length:171 start_codon:yes stop_codon:yes gene_type:complete